MGSTTKASRLDFLDNARTICMLIVVLYHAAHLYESQKDWWVHSSDNSALFDLIISLQKSFCMSAFFLIAGYFSALVIHRRGMSAWLKDRVPRLIVPFLASMLTVQIAQMIVVAQHEGAASAWDFWASYVRENDRINIFHLWFIPCLLILSAGLAAVVRLTGEKSFIWSASFNTAMLYILLIAVSVYMFGRIVPPLFPFTWTIFWQILDFREALYYFAPFLVGAKLCWDQPFRTGFLKRSRWSAAGSFVAYAIVTMTLHADSFIEKALRDIALPIAAILLSQVLISFFYRYFNHSNKISRAFSEASYSIYILHQPIVLMMGILFLRMNGSIFIEYAIVVSTTITLTFLIHRYVIAKQPVLAFLFNGTPLKGSRKTVPGNPG